MAVRIYKDTTSPSLTDTIQVNGTAYDLTGCTVKLQMRAVGSSTLVIDASATVVTAASGSVRYDWVAGDVDTAGDFVAWWRVTLQSGKTQDTSEFAVTVLEHAPESNADLCTVAEVRAHMQTPAGDVTQDQLLQDMITAASRAIRVYTGREFTLESGTAPTTRTLDVGVFWRDREVPVGDMASAPGTVRVLDSDGGTVATLTVATDLVMLPTHRESWEPITFIRFRPDAQSLASDYQLEVTGTFGWPVVPADVRRACVITAATWMRRHVQAFSTGYAPDLEGDGPASDSLPAAARRILYPYRRMVVA